MIGVGMRNEQRIQPPYACPDSLEPEFRACVDEYHLAT
jgi:hypothetical protein